MELFIASKAGNILSTLSQIIVPLLVFSAIFATITLMQHTNVNEQTNWASGKLRNASPGNSTIDYALPPLFELILFYGNIHTIHHLMPKIPFHELKFRSRDLKRTVVVFKISDLVKTLNKCHLYDNSKRRLVSFSEAY